MPALLTRGPTRGRYSDLAGHLRGLLPQAVHIRRLGAPLQFPWLGNPHRQTGPVLATGVSSDIFEPRDVLLRAHEAAKGLLDAGLDGLTRVEVRVADRDCVIFRLTLEPWPALAAHGYPNEQVSILVSKNGNIAAIPLTSNRLAPHPGPAPQPSACGIPATRGGRPPRTRRPPDPIPIAALARHSERILMIPTTHASLTRAEFVLIVTATSVVSVVITALLGTVLGRWAQATDRRRDGHATAVTTLFAAEYPDRIRPTGSDLRRARRVIGHALHGTSPVPGRLQWLTAPRLWPEWRW